MKTKILIFIDWYYPAYKAGGPIQSIKNFVDRFSNDFEIYIFTSNADFDINDILPIEVNKWLNGYKNEKVYYCSKENLRVSILKQVIKEVKPSSIYFNSMYSLWFTILPLFVLKINNFNGKIVVAPRGMLQEGAMKFKSAKKKALLLFLNLFNFPKNIHFQATDLQEEKDINKYFKTFKAIQLVQNLTTSISTEIKYIDKKIDELKIIFLSRIVEKKNLLFLLKNISIIIESKIEIEIWGDIGDELYWKNCQKEIELLHKKGFKVNYFGAIKNELVVNQIRNNHIYVLPTYGENFGHSIFEALSAARPVIISNQTPWLNLSQQKSGFDFDLNDVNQFVTAIEYFVKMDQQEFNIWSKSAYQMAKNYVESTDNKKAYLELFS